MAIQKSITTLKALFPKQSERKALKTEIKSQPTLKTMIQEIKDLQEKKSLALFEISLIMKGQGRNRRENMQEAYTDYAEKSYALLTQYKRLLDYLTTLYRDSIADDSQKKSSVVLHIERLKCLREYKYARQGILEVVADASHIIFVSPLRPEQFTTIRDQLLRESTRLLGECKLPPSHDNPTRLTQFITFFRGKRTHDIDANPPRTVGTISSYDQSHHDTRQRSNAVLPPPPPYQGETPADPDDPPAYNPPTHSV